jgi:Flp pilus assembly protein TadG
MAGLRNRLTRSIRSFRNGSDGAVTVEFVLWVPVFTGLLLLTADASVVFMNQSNFWNVTRDTARIVSRHGLEPEAAEAYARNNAAFGAYTPDVKVEVDDQAATVTVTIIGQSEEMAPFGMLSYALGDTISTRVTQSLEPI